MAFEIIQLPRDDRGIRTCLEEVKNFRLFSLQSAPDAFGSTFAREVEFTDAVWYDRLANPDVVTFVALKAGSIISTITAVSIPDCLEDFSGSSSPWDQSIIPSKDLALLHYRINGMFTAPEARRQGIARDLMTTVIKHGTDEASASGRIFTASIYVDSNNKPARDLYERVGFTPTREEAFNESSRKVMLLKYAAPSTTAQADIGDGSK